MCVFVMLVYNIIFMAADDQCYFPLTVLHRGNNQPTDNQPADFGLNIPKNIFPRDTPHYWYT